MTHATEKVKFGAKPIAVLEIDLDFCTLSYGVGVCNAGEVANDTAQAGAAATITLAAADTQADDYYNQMVIKITGGTGSGQERTISDFVNATKIATVSSNWTTNPDATSTYTIHFVNDPDACYNTRETCLDIANYTKGTKTYRFCEDVSDLPIGIDMLPRLMGPGEVTPIGINPGKDLGNRGVLRITLKDFPHHDRNIDPYIANRTYNAETQGTYFGKLLARNPHYMGRDARYLTGYITDPWDWNNFKTQSFLLEKFEGPRRQGADDLYTIEAKDLLKKAALDRVQIPEPSVGKLTADITATANTAYVDVSTDYGASGTCRIGDEEMTYTRSGLVLTLVRGVNGTTAASHAIDDTVQEARVFNKHCLLALHEMLNADLGIPETKIPYDAGLAVPTGTNDTWDDEEDNWLPGSTAQRTISKPMDIEKAISELLEQFQLTIWHDVFNDKIQLIANAPPLANATVTSLTDATNLLADKTQVKIDQKQRLSRVVVLYKKINNAKDEKASNYDKTFAKIDATRESSDLYDGIKTKTIFATWIGSDESLATRLAGRLLSRYADAPRNVTFEVDAIDDDLELGDLVDLTTVMIPDKTGASAPHRAQIIEKKEKQHGHSYQYKALSSFYAGRYAFIGGNSLNDYGLETEDNQNAYGYMAGASGLYLNGDEAHKII